MPRFGRFVVRVSSSEVSGPSGAGSRAEMAASQPRRDSGIRLAAPRGYDRKIGELQALKRVWIGVWARDRIIYNEAAWNAAQEAFAERFPETQADIARWEAANYG